MSYDFEDCFGSCDERNAACNWTVLSNSDLSHKHCSWESGKYVITATGNRHLPNTPSLSEFTLETTFTFNDSVFENLTAAHPTLRIFFYYDERKWQMVKPNCLLAVRHSHSRFRKMPLEKDESVLIAANLWAYWNSAK